MSSLAKFYAERASKKIHHYNVQIVVAPVNHENVGVGNATVVHGELSAEAFDGDPADFVTRTMEPMGYAIHAALSNNRTPVVTEN